MDSQHFKQIVESHQQKVMNICYRFTLNIEDAEDISQEVFIEVYHALDTFREESRLSTWIFRIAVNKSLDAIRKKNRKKRFTFFKSNVDEDIENLSVDSTSQTSLEDEERKEILQKALNLIPERQRVAITLSKLESMTNREIAEILRTNTSTVDMLIYRAKKSLYKKLFKHYEKLFLILPLVFINNNV